MPKVSLEDFQKWCAGANEEQLLCAKAQLLIEISAGEKMIESVNKRLTYLEFINPENCILRAKALEL